MSLLAPFPWWHAPLRARVQQSCFVLAIVFGAMLGGCQRKSPSATQGTGQGAVKIKVVSKVDYPVAEYVGPLDEGRLRVPVPRDWWVAPRTKYYLCQFSRSRSAKAPLPRIRMVVEPAEGEHWEGWENVTRERVAEFAQQVAATVPQKSLVEPVLPMIIGPHPCARYVDAVKFRLKDDSGRVRSLAGQRQVICLLHKGRLYRCELHVVPGTILDYRDAAYAVVAGLQFVDDDASGSDADVDQPPPGGEPDGKKSAGDS